jgi:hypothetical protein
VSSPILSSHIQKIYVLFPIYKKSQHKNNKIINDTCEVSEKFNTFFSTVADKIGEDIVWKYTSVNRQVYQ